MTRARLELLLQKKPWVKPSREPIGFVNPAGKLVGVIRNDPAKYGHLARAAEVVNKAKVRLRDEGSPQQLREDHPLAWDAFLRQNPDQKPFVEAGNDSIALKKFMKFMEANPKAKAAALTAKASAMSKAIHGATSAASKMAAEKGIDPGVSPQGRAALERRASFLSRRSEPSSQVEAGNINRAFAKMPDQVRTAPDTVEAKTSRRDNTKLKNVAQPPDQEKASPIFPRAEEATAPPAKAPARGSSSSYQPVQRGAKWADPSTAPKDEAGEEVPKTPSRPGLKAVFSEKGSRWADPSSASNFLKKAVPPKAPVPKDPPEVPSAVEEFRASKKKAEAAPRPRGVPITDEYTDEKEWSPPGTSSATITSRAKNRVEAMRSIRNRQAQVRGGKSPESVYGSAWEPVKNGSNAAARLKAHFGM